MFYSENEAVNRSIPTLASNRKVFGDKELRGVERPLSVKMSVKWRLK